jgi:hypothetical protein
MIREPMNRNGYSLPTDPREIARREALGRAVTATEFGGAFH